MNKSMQYSWGNTHLSRQTFRTKGLILNTSVSLGMRPRVSKIQLFDHLLPKGELLLLVS